MDATAPAATDDLAAEAAGLVWYHTIELPGGVVTPGFVDARRCPARLPFPPLEGRRCLDVGTMNGFWAFELERRGAGEVVTIDVDDLRQLDWPARTRLTDPGETYIDQGDRERTTRGFELARGALASRVQRRALNVYDLAPEAVGEFDFVFVGSILLHLRDPVRALERVRSVCSGEAVIFEAIDLMGTMMSPRTPRAALDGNRVWWWTPNARALRRMIESAGFEILERSGIVLLPAGKGFRKVTALEVLRSGPNAIIGAIAGFPHLGWRVRPLA
jgi:tRNA (mo5U34)-methyltransferase